jgi:hypothetical protein
MWERIKEILQKEGGKCIIVEDNQPAYVVMQLKDYEKVKDNKPLEMEEVNRNIDEWKAEEEAKNKAGIDQITGKTEEATEEVKVEDLPF